MHFLTKVLVNNDRSIFYSGRAGQQLYSPFEALVTTTKNTVKR